MSTNESGAEREWKIAIAVVVIGFLVAIAVAAYLTFGPPFTKKQPEQPVARIDVRQVCLTGLVEAVRYGILPQYAKLANANPFATKERGRYACATTTAVATYAVVVDLSCSMLASEKCVTLVGVSRDDKTVLYKRALQRR